MRAEGRPYRGWHAVASVLGMITAVVLGRRRSRLRAAIHSAFALKFLHFLWGIVQQRGQDFYRVLPREWSGAHDHLTTTQLDVLAGDVNTSGNGVWHFHQQLPIMQLWLMRCSGDIVDRI